jgi:hypothetical protein
MPKDDNPWSLKSAQDRYQRQQQNQKPDELRKPGVIRESVFDRLKPKKDEHKIFKKGRG